MIMGTNYTKKDLESRFNLGKEQTFQMIKEKATIACPVCKEEYKGKRFEYSKQLHEEIEEGKDIFAKCERCSEENKKPFLFQIIEETRKNYRRPVSFCAKVYSLPNGSNMLFPSTVINLSREGLQIKTQSTRNIIPYLKNKNIKVDFYLDSRSKPHVKAEGRVCYVNKSKNQHTLGVELTDVRSKKDIGFYLW